MLPLVDFRKNVNIGFDPSVEMLSGLTSRRETDVGLQNSFDNPSDC